MKSPKPAASQLNGDCCADGPAMSLGTAGTLSLGTAGTLSLGTAGTLSLGLRQTADVVVAGFGTAGTLSATAGAAAQIKTTAPKSTVRYDVFTMVLHRSKNECSKLW
jgi:hypothetical protein